MKKNIYKVSGLIITLSVITALITPLFASAQNVTASSSTSAQVQLLLSQITALQLQLKTLVYSSMNTGAGSTTTSSIPSMDNLMGSTTMTHGDMGRGLGVMRCLPLIHDLSMGSRGDDVSNLQQMLSDNGFLSGSSTTGFFGSITAHAVMQFQNQFGVSASSTGIVGPLTRNFLRNHCGNGMNENGTSTTSGMWQNGAPNHDMPMMRHRNGDDENMNNGTSTDDRFMHPLLHAMASTTMPMHPCMQNATSTENEDNAASAMLFVLHAQIPGMMHPCSSVMGEMQQR
jgi:hypothetical protein